MLIELYAEYTKETHAMVHLAEVLTIRDVVIRGAAVLVVVVQDMVTAVVAVIIPDVEVHLVGIVDVKLFKQLKYGK